jgi:pimeloyl-ACP methyl ester carboxylesterase
MRDETAVRPRELIVTRAPRTPPALVGHSWGAMLALCYAAAHPREAGPVVLIGCGTFDPVARDVLQTTLKTRSADRQPLYDPVPDAEPQRPLDSRAHDETWRDMLRLQADATYPRAFAAIRSPVLMLHGAYDPHPGPLIRDGLRPLIPALEYREWEQCGHSPWLEPSVRDEFFGTLKRWLARRIGEAAA